MKWSFHPYDIPLVRPYRWANGAQTRRTGLLVRLEAEHVAWGECAPPPHAVPPGMAEAAGRLVSGLDPADEAFLDHLDARRPDPRLRAGIAMAWLDHAAQAEGETLAAFLARGSGATPAYAVPVNALITAEEPAAAAVLAKRAMDAGFSTIKIKCGADREADLARVEVVRDAAPAAVLRLDANGSWDVPWAHAHLEALEPFGPIEYVEQPLPPGDLAAMAQLRATSPVPIAADEDAADLAAIEAIVAMQAADHVIVKPQRLGGPDRAVAALDLGISATVTNSLETHVGMAAALHVASLLRQPMPACGLATGDLLREDVAQGLSVHDGMMALPDGPGLGISVLV